MYILGTDLPAWQVMVNFTIFLVVLFAFAAAPPLLAGLVCGWCMPALSIRNGLIMGLVVGVIASLLSLAAILVQAPSLAIALLPISAGMAWLLCWRNNRKGR